MTNYKEYATKVAELNNLLLERFLGKGSYAEAWLLSDGKVIKITKDVHDYNMAIKIKNLRNIAGVETKYIVNIHQVIWLRQSGLYCIITDYVELNSHYYHNNYNFLHRFCEEFIKRGKVLELEKFRFDDDDEIPTSYDILYHHCEIAVELKTLGFVAVDLHHENIGFINGHPIIFDFGHYSSESNDPLMCYNVLDI